MLMQGSRPDAALLLDFRMPTLCCSRPPPMGGCGNPQLVRDILDSCKWLASLPAYPLKGSMRTIVATIEDYAKGEGVPLSCHHDTVAYLPHSLSEYEGAHVTSAGRSNIPPASPALIHRQKKNL